MLPDTNMRAFPNETSAHHHHILLHLSVLGQHDQIVGNLLLSITFLPFWRMEDMAIPCSLFMTAVGGIFGTEDLVILNGLVSQ